jgi:hypothetical protein
MKGLSSLLLFKFTLLKYISIHDAVTRMNQNMYEPNDDYIYNWNA